MGWEALSRSVAANLEPWIPVSIPKRVAVQNFRLGVLLWLFRGFIIVYIVTLMWSQRPWRIEVRPAGTNSFWAQLDAAAYRASQASDAAKDFCDPVANKRYEYQYDAVGRYRYTDIGCVNVPFSEVFVKGESELFMPTFFQENTTVYTDVGDSNSSDAACASACAGLEGCQPGLSYEFTRRSRASACQCECVSSEDNFVTGVEDLEVAFEHTVQVERPDGGEEEFRWDDEGGSGLLTVVWDPKGRRELRRFEPGELVALSVREILEFAGSSLDHSVATIANKIPGADPLPLVRMTGVEILAKLTYYNTGISGHTTDWKRPVCLLELVAREGWNSRPVTDWLESPGLAAGGLGSYRFKYNYGIRVRFVTSGSFTFFDPTQFFFFMASVIVYIQVPGIVVAYLMWYGLGGLSNIYYLASNQRVVILELFEGLLARSLQAKYSFESQVRAVDGAGAEEAAPGTRTKDGAGAEEAAPGSRNKIRAVAGAAGGGGAARDGHDGAALRSRTSRSTSVVMTKAGSLMSNKVLDRDIHSLFNKDQATGDGGGAGAGPAPAEVETIEGITMDGPQVKIMRGLVQGHHRRGGGGDTQYCSVQDFIDAATNSDPAALRDLAVFLDPHRKRAPLECLFESRHRIRQIYQMMDSAGHPEDWE